MLHVIYKFRFLLYIHYISIICSNIMTNSCVTFCVFLHSNLVLDNLDKTSLRQVQDLLLNACKNSETTQFHSLDIHMLSFHRMTHLVHSSTMFYYRAVGSILKPVRLFSSVGMTLNLIIEEVVFLV